MNVLANERSVRKFDLILYFEGRATGGVTGILDGLRRTLPATMPIGMVCSSGPELQDWRALIEREGCTVFPLALFNRAGLLGWFEIFRMIALVRIFRHARIVHFHQHTPFSCLPAIICGRIARNQAMISTEHYAAQLKFLRRRHLPFLLSWIRELRIRVQIRMKRLTLRALQTIVLVSQANLETFQTAFRNTGQPRLAVIPNGIPIRATDPDRSLARQHVRSLCGGGNFEHIVITVAALNNQKGHVILLQAVPLVLAHYPSTAFLCIGDGHLRSFLEHSRESRGLKGKVFFAGIRQDVPQLLDGADLFVLPSRFEGMPLSVLEAMAAGCTVVATAVDGTREVVLHETTGLLVPPDEPEALAESIVRLLGNPSYCARLARAGRHRVETEFAVHVMASRYLQEYERLLAGEERRSL